jgi:hypothetical protein
MRSDEEYRRNRSRQVVALGRPISRFSRQRLLTSGQARLVFRALLTGLLTVQGSSLEVRTSTKKLALFGMTF